MLQLSKVLDAFLSYLAVISVENVANQIFSVIHFNLSLY